MQHINVWAFFLNSHKKVAKSNPSLFTNCSLVKVILFLRNSFSSTAKLLLAVSRRHIGRRWEERKCQHRLNVHAYPSGGFEGRGTIAPTPMGRQTKYCGHKIKIKYQICIFHYKQVVSFRDASLLLSSPSLKRKKC